MMSDRLRRLLQLLQQYLLQVITEPVLGAAQAAATAARFAGAGVLRHRACGPDLGVLLLPGKPHWLAGCVLLSNRIRHGAAGKAA